MGFVVTLRIVPHQLPRWAAFQSKRGEVDCGGQAGALWGSTGKELAGWSFPGSFRGEDGLQGPLTSTS